MLFIFLMDLFVTTAWVAAAFVLVGVIFIFLYKASKRKDIREKGLIPIHAELCRGNWGREDATFPFVRLTLYEDFMVVSASGPLVIEYRQIREVRNIGWAGTGIEIITTNPSRYGQPSLYGMNSQKVKSLIEEKAIHSKSAYYKNAKKP